MPYLVEAERSAQARGWGLLIKTVLRGQSDKLWPKQHIEDVVFLALGDWGQLRCFLQH